jgi:hypothetical protein
MTMTKLLLSLHVLAAVLAVGPVTVAAGMFPAVLRKARSDPGDVASRAVLGTLHRICRVYAGIGIAVPVLGLATGGSLGVLGDAWLIASMVLTAVAAGVLVALLLPGQEDALGALDATASGAASGAEARSPAGPGAGARGGGGGGAAGAGAGTRLMALTGVLNLLWVTVTVLMIVRPGSTTGA